MARGSTWVASRTHASNGRRAPLYTYATVSLSGAMRGLTCTPGRSAMGSSAFDAVKTRRMLSSAS